MLRRPPISCMFTYRRIFPFCVFFNDTATTEIYTLSLHDALPILVVQLRRRLDNAQIHCEDPRDTRHNSTVLAPRVGKQKSRSEEHTSELQSRQYLVCRLLLEKKKRRAHVLTPVTPNQRMTPSS